MVRSTRSRIAWLWLAGACVLLGACGANNIRPRLHAKTDAVLDTIPGIPEVVLDSLRTEVSDRGFKVSRVSLVEGFLETSWFDLDNDRAGGTYTRHPDRVIRLRFFAEPTSLERTVLRSEAVFRRTLDPSVSGDVAEQMVPINHPGDSLLQQILDTVRPESARVGT